MSLHLTVFCRSGLQVTCTDIAEFVRNGWYFDEPPRFECTPIESAPDWKHLAIHYQDGKRPVMLYSYIGQDLAERVRETIGTLREAGGANYHELIRTLEASQRAFGLEVDPVGATVECWQMLDNLEAYLARQCDGLIVISGEGIYDTNLKLIFKI